MISLKSFKQTITVDTEEGYKFKISRPDNMQQLRANQIAKLINKMNLESEENNVENAKKLDEYDTELKEMYLSRIENIGDKDGIAFLRENLTADGLSSFFIKVFELNGGAEEK